MKKITLVLTILLAVSFTAHAQTVGSANIMGYTKITMPASGWIMVGYSFDVEGELTTLNDIYGTNQLAQHDFNPGLCDQVMLWSTNTLTYQAWAQKTDGVFYKANDMGQFIGGDTGTVAEITVTPGMGMWLINSGSEKTVLFSGDVIALQTQTVSIASGWQILSYPLSSCTNMLTFTETDLVESGAATHDFNPGLCDQIIVWNNGAYQAYAPKNNGTWYKANDMAEFLAGHPMTNTVSLGDGFWYVAQTKMTWAESSRYYSKIQ